MELIIIRGRQNDGKTTTATLVHNELVGRCTKVRMVRTNGGYLSVGKNVVDFQSVIDLGKKRVVIISEGDDDDRLFELMQDLIDDYRPDFVVVCARAYDRVGSSYRMLTERFANLIIPENEIRIEYSEDPAKMGEVKQKAVETIVSRIIK